MKTVKDWKKEADKVLADKSKELIKAYDSERQGLFEELASLSETLEKFEAQKKELLATQETEAKNFIPSQKILNECALKLQHFEKLIRERKKQIEVVFGRLTSLPEFMKDYPFFKMISG